MFLKSAVRIYWLVVWPCSKLILYSFRYWSTPPPSHAHALQVQLPWGNYIASISLHRQILITCGGNKHQTDPLTSPKGPLLSLYRGVLKAPCAAEAAALAVAWRTAWLDMTPVANSAWAFWKLASVCLYRLWTWRMEEQTPDICGSSSTYQGCHVGETDTLKLIWWLFFLLFVSCCLLNDRRTTGAQGGNCSPISCVVSSKGVCVSGTLSKT